MLERRALGLGAVGEFAEDDRMRLYRTGGRHNGFADSIPSSVSQSGRDSARATAIRILQKLCKMASRISRSPGFVPAGCRWILGSLARDLNRQRPGSRPTG